MKSMVITCLISLMVINSIDLSYAQPLLVRLHECDNRLYQKMNKTLSFSMVMDYCEQENMDTLLKAAEVWFKKKTIGFEKALCAAKLLEQNEGMDIEAGLSNCPEI